MDHSRIYQRLMDSAKGRKRSSFLERHHVVPRCLGGGDQASNIVNLTPREHYVSHLLLCHMHPEVNGLKLAVVLMSGRCKMRKSRAYESIRRSAMEERSRSLKGKARPKEHMEAMWEAVRTRKRTPEHCQNISKAKIGRRLSPEHRRRISEGNSGKKMTPEHILRSAIGQSSLTDETVKSIRKAYDAGGVMDHISRKHGVSLSLGARIMKRQSYKWVSESA